MVFKCGFEFAYRLVTFYSRYKLSFAAYLTIPALISGLYIITQTLDLLFTLDSGIPGGAHNSLHKKCSFH